MDVDISDAQAAIAAGKGDSNAFMVLVHRYRSPLIGYITARTGRRDEAEELVQEVFCRAWAQIPRLRQPERVAGWLYKIADNLAASTARRPIPGPLTDDPPERAATKADAEVLLAVHRAVAELREDQRVVVSLHHFTGLSQDEIATRLGVPVGTVRSRLSRAYERLRRRLAALAEE